MERFTQLNSELQSTNPSLLGIVTDSILLNVNSYYNYGKGDFVNYYSPDQYYNAGLSTQSYNRLNNKTVVHGYASYAYYKGDNSSGTSFLYPYRMPFNFIERDEEAKGERQIEQYHLKGAISYLVSSRLSLGTKVDYQTISFAKLKDMRNANDILDLKLSSGLIYQLSDKIKLGISYKYLRYIENLEIFQEGEANIDHYALVDRGTFMGVFHVYDEQGLLKTDSHKPWVDITHGLAIQNSYHFDKNSTWFIELACQTGKGQFGNDGDNGIVYFRHTKTNYLLTTQFNFLNNTTSHIISGAASYYDLNNNEQIFKESTSDGGLQLVTYIGEKESLKRQHYDTRIRYNLLWGDNYFKAPWQLQVAYSYSNIQRQSSYYPYYRKQNITWSEINFSISKTIINKKTAFTIGCSSGYKEGRGGEPIDGSYIPFSGSTEQPDNLDHILYKEKEYLTARQLTTSATMRADYIYSKNMDIYLQLKGSCLKPFNLEYLEGDFISLSVSAGLSF
ncbi:hypothetical protein J1N10_06015 [Carboxylicivirga sp. A043]|uniref:DUF6850 family outer membrane beta-barrel protein n=1 Tax=Carboxylicivirga litoralis TaxID=2816963 RepID=UPI0021CB77A9|nr:DUF6850 family outer membrane beta-barrel protein [Carboxylicivirga sp. A043]MCU4155523.1 hypothetical protein [Carboxylicivirga sp. A043]